jgi:hypothetical protein
MVEGVFEWPNRFLVQMARVEMTTLFEVLFLMSAMMVG